MKWFALMLFIPTVSIAGSCKPGYVPSDTPGVCLEKPVTATNPEWVSEEKPPSDKMPSYQREGITVINAPNMADEDAKSDRDRSDATAEGRKSAGLK